MPAPSPPKPAKTLSAPQKALIKLGLKRDIDLALHLPLRYEDETRIVKLRDAREGDVAQIEATVTACEITLRPRRQLLVTVDDGSDTCVMRFFSFYPSHQKALAVGSRIRARGEVKGGFMGCRSAKPAMGWNAGWVGCRFGSCVACAFAGLWCRVWSVPDVWIVGPGHHGGGGYVHAPPCNASA